jgi:hypothetical protein
MPFNRTAKINALITLLDFSLIIPEDMKIVVKEKINQFSDQDIMNLGKILAYEHENREKLDKSMLETFVKSLNRSVE